MVPKGRKKEKKADRRKDGLMTLEKWQVRCGAEWLKIDQSGKDGLTRAAAHSKFSSFKGWLAASNVTRKQRYPRGKIILDAESPSALLSVNNCNHSDGGGRPLGFSLSRRNTTAEADSSPLYSVRVWYLDSQADPFSGYSQVDHSAGLPLYRL
ncbi:hypothetical protein EVAR_45441_1 [Eumeta japonica]|uniref:Uncharacterized protein n=1 Tax=Eumeta variegata TaxID=151549 RepID=A0A4C1YK74_EUMVA|nr:hypothetical protein EVAR_45441_1 [Eumeta japonica]